MYSKIWEKYRGTSVSILAEFPKRDGTILQITSDGFFVNEKGYICTTFHSLISTDKTLIFPDCAEYVVAQSIKASITNYNGKPVYRSIVLEIVGRCGSADIAVLRPIVTKDQEPFTNQPFLKFGDHSTLLPGTEVFNIGDPGGLDLDSFVNGIVRDNSWSYKELPYESLLTTISIRGGNSGGAIIDANGKVFGMIQFFVQNNSFSAGIVSETLEFIVSKIIKGKSSRFIDKCGNFISQYAGIIVGPYNMFAQSLLQDPDPNLQGQIVAESTISKLPIGTVLVKANGNILHDDSITRTTFEDILWKSRIGDTIKIHYKGKSTNWELNKIKLIVEQLPCHLDIPFAFLSSNTLVTPTAWYNFFGNSTSLKEALSNIF